MSLAATIYVDKVMSFFDTHGAGRPADATTDLIASGRLDSLGLAVFLSYLEEEFHIDIATDEVTPEHFGTVASTVQFLEEKLRGR